MAGLHRSFPVCAVIVLGSFCAAAPAVRVPKVANAKHGSSYLVKWQQFVDLKKHNRHISWDLERHNACGRTLPSQVKMLM